MQPLVSVIIPTYKRPDYLANAIESVLAQTYKNFEIIVVDDNNPDTEGRILTEQLMKKYENRERIRYIQHSHNKNGSAARNTGFKNSQGQYIMFLDDDDEFTAVKIQAQMKCLQSRDESWGACYSNYVRFNTEGKIIMRGAETREGNLLVEELKRNLFVHAGSNLMIRREVFCELNGFDESFQRNQDVEFLVRLLTKYKLAYVPELGLRVRVHEKKNVDFEQLTKMYIRKFEDTIEQLPPKQREEVYQFFDLQIFRSKVMTNGQRIAALKMVFQGVVPLGLALRYCLHLTWRKITKKAYGFQ